MAWGWLPPFPLLPSHALFLMPKKDQPAFIVHSATRCWLPYTHTSCLLAQNALSPVCLPLGSQRRKEQSRISSSVIPRLVGIAPTVGIVHFPLYHSACNDYLNIRLAGAVCPFLPCPPWCLAQRKGSASMEEMKDAMMLEEKERRMRKCSLYFRGERV